MRRSVDDVLGVIWLVVLAGEKVTDNAAEFYRSLRTASPICLAAQAATSSIELLRDEDLEERARSFFMAVAARIESGHLDIVPDFNRPQGLPEEHEAARKRLTTYVGVIRNNDVPAAKALRDELGVISNWFGFARHRLMGRRLRDRRFKRQR